MYLFMYDSHVHKMKRWAANLFGALAKERFFSESLGVAMPYFNRSIEVRSAWCGPAAALNVLRPWLETDYKRIARLIFFFTEIPWRTTKKQPSIGLLPCAGAASVRKVLHEYVVPWLKPF